MDSGIGDALGGASSYLGGGVAAMVWDLGIRPFAGARRLAILELDLKYYFILSCPSGSYIFNVVMNNPLYYFSFKTSIMRRAERNASTYNYEKYKQN